MTDLATTSTGTKTISGKSKVNDFEMPKISSIKSYYEPDDHVVFKNLHMANRGCHKLLKQAVKEKDY